MTSIASRLVAVSALALAHPGVSHAIGDLGDNATDKPLSSEDSHKALLSTITWPGEMKASVFARQPDVQDPTAIAFDEQNRLYVAETHRFARGIEDNRRNGHWLRDEIALSSTAERLQMYLKHQNVRPLSHYTEYSEVVRVLEDKDNDGVADEARIFADGFRDPLDGTAAGIMAANGKVYLACIPPMSGSCGTRMATVWPTTRTAWTAATPSPRSASHCRAAMSVPAVASSTVTARPNARVATSACPSAREAMPALH
ncbi:MAG: DUF7133 domain-containing protein [Luteolibacter sp.]